MKQGILQQLRQQGPGQNSPGQNSPGQNSPGKNSPGKNGRRGYSMIELVVVCTLVVILAGAVFPVARFTVRRQKEMELRRCLRMMRNAIDDHKRFSDAGLIPIEVGGEGYPEELEDLIEGIDLVGQIDKKQKFMRRIPIDPMTGEAEWGKRSLQDDWDSTSWGGENVYDVYSLSKGVGLNGVPYSEW